VSATTISTPISERAPARLDVPSSAAWRWLSFQRYSLLLVLGPTLLLSFSLWWMPEVRWLWLSLLALAVPCLVGAVSITRRLKHKLAFAAEAYQAMAAGQFEAASVQPWCTAPCDRIVANDVLKQAGVSIRDRWSLIRELNIKEREMGGMLVFVNENDGLVYTYQDGQVTSEPIGVPTAESKITKERENGNSTGW